MSRSIMPFNTASALPTSGTNYTNCFGSGSPASVATYLTTYLGMLGTLSNFFIKTSGLPGAGAEWIFTLFRNGSATSVANGGAAIVLTITNSSPTDALGYAYVSDSINKISVSLEDTFYWAETVTGTPASGKYMSGGMVINGSVAKQSPLYGNSGSTALSNIDTTVNYLALSGNRSNINITAEISNQIVAPCSGTIKNLYAYLSAAPGVGKSRDITIYKNGLPSAVTCNIAGAAATSNSDLTHSISVATGDLISIYTINNGGAAAAVLRVYATFEADTDGYFMLSLSSATRKPSNAATGYSAAYGCPGNNWASGIATMYQASPIGYTAKAIYVALGGAPFADNVLDSYTFKLYNNGAATGLLIELANLTTSANYATDVAMNTGDLFAIQSVPNSSPTAQEALVSILGYIAPTGLTINGQLCSAAEGQAVSAFEGQS